jgi:hypothetical protein
MPFTTMRACLRSCPTDRRSVVMSHGSVRSRVSRGSGFESLPMSITRAIFDEAQSPDGSGTGSRHNHHLSLPESTFQLDEETERKEWTRGAPSETSDSPIEAKTFRVLELLREVVEPGEAGEGDSENYTITTVSAPVPSNPSPSPSRFREAARRPKKTLTSRRVPVLAV